jgi:membrane-bound serine protease (ClpP class)
MKKLLLIAGLIPLISISVFAQKPKIMLMEIKDEIDPRMTRYIHLAIDHAEEIKADIVVIDMDTYGGGLTDAKDIAKILLDFKKPIWVYVNSNAISAGALISIA